MAKNHKWMGENEAEYMTKPHVCKKCGVRKKWHGGDYQAWEYSWATKHKAHNGESILNWHESWIRPECIG